MKYIKLLSMLLLVGILPFIATSCGSDDDDNPENPNAKVQLYVYVYDSETGNRIQNVDVEFVQNGKSLCVDNTGTYGFALCSSEYDDLKAGTVTVNINTPGYKAFSRTDRITEASTDWDVYLAPDGTGSMTMTMESVEDLYGTLSITMDHNIDYIRVSEGSSYNPDSFKEYKNPYSGDDTHTYTQEIVYTNLVPDSEYTFSAAAFNKSNKKLYEKTVSCKTKKLTNRSMMTLSVIDFMTINSGIAVTYARRADVHLACYEVSKVPSDEMTIIKDAMRGSSLEEYVLVSYASGLKPGTKYRLFVLPMSKQQIPNSEFYTYWPGELGSVDFETAAADNNARAVVEMVSNTKSSFTYRFAEEGNVTLFKQLKLNAYYIYESYPDITLAYYCSRETESERFSYGYSDTFTWSNLDISSWYGIISFAYTGSGRNLKNSGVISRYKFKYGAYGVQASRAEDYTQDVMSFGSIDENMLRDVKPF